MRPSRRAATAMRTGYIRSPATPSASRLVARMRNPGHARSSVLASLAQASIRCSHVSRTSSISRDADVGEQRLVGVGVRLVRHTECNRDLLRHEAAVGQRLELDEPRAIDERVERLGGELQREARLADTARPVSVTSGACAMSCFTSVRSDCRPTKLLRLRGRLFGSVVSERSGGNARGRPSTLSWYRCSGSARSLSQCWPRSVSVDRGGQLAADEIARRLRQQDLAAVAGRCDARGAMDVHAEVARPRADRLAGVQAHPRPHD